MHSADDHILFPHHENQDSSGEKLLHHWWGIVSSYTGCKITVPADKLVAIAGIAQLFRSLLNDNYICGLWEQTFIEDLLWSVFGPGEPRPSEYRAPTWSWASVDGTILGYTKHMLEESSKDYEAEILTYQVTLKNMIHPFGEVVEASMTMRAKILPLMLNGMECTFIERKGVTGRMGSTSGYWVPPKGNCLESRFFSDTLAESDGSANEERVAASFESDEGTSQDHAESDGSESEERVRVMFDSDEGTSQDHKMGFYVIILRSGRTWGDFGQAGYRDKGWMRGILALRDSSEAEQYRRVAMLDIWDFKGLDWFDNTSPRLVTLV